MNQNDKTVQQYIERAKIVNERREAVKKENERLIAYWSSIPWWKFWVKKPSFEEQRSIIMGNWSSVEHFEAQHFTNNQEEGQE